MEQAVRVLGHAGETQAARKPDPDTPHTLCKKQTEFGSQR